MNSTSHSHRIVKSLYNRMKVSSLTLSACPTTGIIITLDIPFVAGKVLTYENPLARIENAREIALLSYKEASKISPHILAGSLLTILCHYEKIEDHLSSVERNALLSTVPVYHLWESMRFFASQTARKISHFPCISLTFVNTEYTSTLDILKNYIEVCSQSLTENSYSPSFSTSISTTTARTGTNKKAKKVESLSVETKKRAQALVSLIISSETINTKLISLLKLIVTGNNLVTVHKDVRDKLIKKFSEMQSPSSKEFAILLQDIEKNTSPVERVFIQKDDEVLNTLTSELPSYGAKKTLKEILEEKRLGIPKQQVATSPVITASESILSESLLSESPVIPTPILESSILSTTKETKKIESIEELEDSKLDVCQLMLQVEVELLEEELSLSEEEDSDLQPDFNPDEF